MRFLLALLILIVSLSALAGPPPGWTPSLFSMRGQCLAPLAGLHFAGHPFKMPEGKILPDPIYGPVIVSTESQASAGADYERKVAENLNKHYLRRLTAPATLVALETLMLGRYEPDRGTLAQNVILSRELQSLTGTYEVDRDHGILRIRATFDDKEFEIEVRFKQLPDGDLSLSDINISGKGPQASAYTTVTLSGVKPIEVLGRHQKVEIAEEKLREERERRLPTLQEQASQGKFYRRIGRDGFELHFTVENATIDANGNRIFLIQPPTRPVDLHIDGEDYSAWFGTMLHTVTCFYDHGKKFNATYEEVDLPNEEVGGIPMLRVTFPPRR